MEDYKQVVRCIFEQEHKLLDIIDRFTLIDEHFWITLGFTKIINELFEFLQRVDSERFKELQAFFLMHTVQFIFHIIQLLSSPLEA